MNKTFAASLFQFDSLFFMRNLIEGESEIEGRTYKNLSSLSQKSKLWISMTQLRGHQNLNFRAHLIEIKPKVIS